MAETQKPAFVYHPEAELVFAVVCPLGTDDQKVVNSFSNYLGQYGYRTNVIRLSQGFPELLEGFGESWSPGADTGNEHVDLARYKISARESRMAPQKAGQRHGRRPLMSFVR